MQKKLYCKILAIGIIILFIGAGIHPAFAVENKPSMVNKASEEECWECKEVNDRQLVVLERQLNRLEVYSKLLLVLSRYNPELREISEELLKEISTLKEELAYEPPYPILCKIFWGLYIGLYPIVVIIQTLYEYFPNLREIIYNIASIIVLNYYIIQGLAFGFCGLFPDYP